jgi:uncharacterized HAD superfamily protein
MTVYAFDLDGTLCKEDGDFENFTTSEDWHNYYQNCKPIPETIRQVRFLYYGNHKIIIWTSRRSEDFYVTKKWLEDNRVPFHELVLGKLRVDFYIDNNSLRPEEL